MKGSKLRADRANVLRLCSENTCCGGDDSRCAEQTGGAAVRRYSDVLKDSRKLQELSLGVEAETQRIEVYVWLSNHLRAQRRTEQRNMGALVSYLLNNLIGQDLVVGEADPFFPPEVTIPLVGLDPFASPVTPIAKSSIPWPKSA